MSASAFGQHQQVFIDRGTDDGIQPGMVFRVYQHNDPGTGKKMTSSDYIISADVMVAQVSARFASALVIRSLVQLNQGETGILLTDVSDVQKIRGVREKSIEGNKEKPLDRLDDLDVSGGLGKDEAKELRELEKFKEQGKDKEPPPAPEQGTPGQDQNPNPQGAPAEGNPPQPTEGSQQPPTENVPQSTPSEINPNASAPAQGAPAPGAPAEPNPPPPSAPVPETAPAPAPEAAPAPAPEPPAANGAPPPAQNAAPAPEKSLDDMLNN
jgi:hypothetical protein